MISKVWNYKFRGSISAIILAFSIFLVKFIEKIKTLLFTSNVMCGKNVKIMYGVRYRYPKVINLGDSVIIGAHTLLSSENLQNHYLEINNYVSIGKNCNIDFSGGIKICENAHLGHNVLILTHDHGYNHKNLPIGKPLLIEENAFIGTNCVVLHNVSRIGKNAVIGTGSVITKDVPDNAIVAGNPARIIKYI